MNRTVRFAIAVAVVGILVAIAGGVWASPRLQGTVPPIPITGGEGCPGTVDMGTALFTPQADECSITVDLISTGAADYVAPPQELASLSDAFKVTIDPATVLVSVCYAYPPEIAEKEARIYKLNEEANPQVWVEVPGAEVSDGVICVTTTAGTFALIGKP
ncbi:MAG: hypothetical protein AB1649_04665 [Chloroflexota bacterium]